jgi:hypothetical protein
MYALASILGASTYPIALLIAAVVVLAFRSWSRKAWLPFPAVLVVAAVPFLLVQVMVGYASLALRLAVSAIHVGLLYLHSGARLPKNK